MGQLEDVRRELRAVADPARATVSQRFFKTGKGQYGEGDVFLGVTVPQQRVIAKRFLSLSLEEISTLLASKIHEERFIALLILVLQCTKAKKDEHQRREIYEFYLRKTDCINNWDLVDVSCEKIVGEFLFTGDKGVLRQLAVSKNIWERRIAIVSTFAFIKKKRFGETLAIAELLLSDDHDLIHKATGWMLREVGKRDVEVLRLFLKSHYKEMPRTMLRYAIEKFPPEARKQYLEGTI